MVKHQYGPKMGVDQAINYLQKSRGWGYVVLKQFQDHQNVDFSENKGQKRCLTNRRLREMGLRYKATLPKPLLKVAHIEQRLEFATINAEADWSRVIFSDDARFE